MLCRNSILPEAANYVSFYLPEFAQLIVPYLLGREALGWFVDMSAIGASIGYFFTAASTLVTVRRDGDGTGFLKAMAATGVIFAAIFMILQLIPIPGLSGVHFGKESYIMLVVWIMIGLVFYMKQRKFFSSED